jgi:hypothetical protein
MIVDYKTNDPDYKSGCGCEKGNDLIGKYAVIEKVKIDGVLTFRISVGRNLESYHLFENVVYCPCCGNRLDGEVSKE